MLGVKVKFIVEATPAFFSCFVDVEGGVVAEATSNAGVLCVVERGCGLFGSVA